MAVAAKFPGAPHLLADGARPIRASVTGLWVDRQRGPVAISSMTGFARSVGQANDCAWAWEVRSVNGKGLDARCRLPAGFEALELKARERATRKLKRGSIWMTLTVTRSVRQADIQVNTDALDRIIALLPEIQRRLPDFRRASAEGLLGLRGIVEIIDQQPT